MSHKEHKTEKNIRSLMLDEITLDGGTQVREEIDSDVAREYAAAMKGGEVFPPITVFHDGKIYWLADGFHRFNAALSAGKKAIECEVQKGNKRDAIIFGISANSKHGLRMTNGDKRKAVGVILKDPEWSKWSDRKIAEHCGVTHPFVGKLRKDLSGNGYQTSGESGEEESARPLLNPADPQGGTDTGENISDHPVGDNSQEHHEAVPGSLQLHSAASKGLDSFGATEPQDNKTEIALDDQHQQLIEALEHGTESMEDGLNPADSRPESVDNKEPDVTPDAVVSADHTSSVSDTPNCENGCEDELKSTDTQAKSQVDSTSMAQETQSLYAGHFEIKLSECRASSQEEAREKLIMNLIEMLKNDQETRELMVVHMESGCSDARRTMRDAATDDESAITTVSNLITPNIHSESNDRDRAQALH